MTWARSALALSDVLSIILVIRLINLHLHDVYRIFSYFLLFEVFSESFIFVDKFTNLDQHLDYRLIWLSLRLGSWLLSIWMVYALLQAILKGLPGILRLSRKILSYAFPLSLVVALLTAVPEYTASGAADVADRLDYVVTVALILERLISTIALFTLVLMLVFVLWFPVRMPRNLALFSIGFGVYFSAKTCFLIFHNFWSHETLPIVDNGVTSILCICLAYWITFLNRQGEVSPVTMGHSWESAKQAKLLNNLESINAALERAGRR